MEVALDPMVRLSDELSASLNDEEHRVGTFSSNLHSSLRSVLIALCIIERRLTGRLFQAYGIHQNGRERACGTMCILLRTIAS